MSSNTPIRPVVPGIGLALLLLPWGALAAAAPANLVRNPSCEEAGEDGRPAAWSLSYSSAGACDLVVDSQVKRRGRGSIRLANHEGAAKYPRMIQPVPVQANMRYRLTAWVRSTTGRANLQVTPTGSTWFGAKTYGAAMGIPASREWRQIQKRFTTAEAATVNVVFTLATPNREAADLWVDDVRLVNEGPKPDMSRFIPSVDSSVVLPHVAWAQNLPGPRRRLLFMAPAITIRDVIELARRMDVDAAIHYASADVSDLLTQPWDAIVLAGVHWGHLQPPVRAALWEKVRAGTGLFVVNPIGEDEALVRVLGTLEPSASRAFFAQEEQTDLPCLGWLRQGAGLRVGTLDKGRVAMTDYPVGVESSRRQYWAQRVCSLFPPHEGRVPRADEMPWWEPWYALFARVALWTAGDPACEIVEVSTDDISRDAVTVRVQLDQAGPRRGKGKGEDGPVTSVRVACVGPGNREVGAATAPVDLETGRASVDLAAPFCTGDHFAWVWARDADGRTLSWAAHLFRVPGPTVTVTTDRDRYEPGDTVRGLVKVTDNRDDSAQVEVSLVDSFGRVVDRTRAAAAGEVPFELAAADVRSITARVAARLTAGINGRPRVECESYRVIPVAREPDDRDYLVGIWASYYELTCGRPWSHHLVRLQREMGVDFALMAHAGGDIYHQAYAEHNMVPAPENMHRIFFKLAERFKKMNLADPAFEPTFRQTIRERARTGYRWGAYDFSVGDECGYKARYDEHSLARFRQWLANRHGDIATLNENWGTNLETWDQVTAELVRQGVARSVSIGPWLEFAAFNDRLFTGFFGIAQQEVRKLNRRNRCGLSGTREPGHYIGFDWYELMKNITHLAFYDGLQRECIRSFMKPGDLITSFVGYDFLDLDERNARYFPWLELFNGFQGISIYSASSSDWHGYVRHDLTWTKRAKWTMEELSELKAGVGRAILTATRDPAPIAVLYSQRSLHAVGVHRRWLHNATGLCETIKDLGLQFDFVADDQVAKGALDARRYEVLFLPLAVALADAEAAAIERFARRGGRVIAVGRAGVFNEYGRTREKGALDELFGVSTPTRKPPPIKPPDKAVAHLFGARLEVMPNAVTVPEGLGEFEGLGLRPCARREVGRGEAIFLNFLWTRYRLFRSGGVGGEITHRVSADAETAGAYWRVMTELLAGTGIEPPADVTHAGRPLRYIEQVVYRRGPITYLGLLPRYFGGRYARAEERILITPEDYTAVDVAPTMSGFVYDVRARSGLGRVRSLQTKVTDGVALLYAVTPYEVAGLTLAAPATARAGDSLDVAVVVQASTGEPGDHVVHVRLLRPDGHEAGWARHNLLTRAGRGAWQPRLALNAAPGTWRVEARELISGRTAQARIAVTAE